MALNPRLDAKDFVPTCTKPGPPKPKYLQEQQAQTLDHKTRLRLPRLTLPVDKRQNLSLKKNRGKLLLHVGGYYLTTFHGLIISRAATSQPVAREGSPVLRTCCFDKLQLRELRPGNQPSTLQDDCKAATHCYGSITSIMAAPSARPTNQGYHQDYIARIRYENPLPPPPGAPKLLNIPTEGLTYYTSAAFSSRLARQQPLNIEADAELGMPIDLVGMPGIFDGDESSIQAPLAIPPVHPKDKNLLRPLAELGKPAFNTSGYSFLRRTEYISSEAKARAEANANAAKHAAKVPAVAKTRRPTEVMKEDPMNMLRSVIKGFDLANPENAYTGSDTASNFRGTVPTPAEKDAWNRPKHPSKPDVKLLDAYPLLPDLEAITDSGAYMVTKFTGNPTTRTESRDTRMDVGIIYPREHASGTSDFDFFLPMDEAAAVNMKRKLDVYDPDRDDPSLYTNKAADGSGTFRYPHIRTYESTRRIDTDQQYKEIALALHDTESEGDEADTQTRGAYYYPVVTKLQMKPRRNKNLVQLGLASQAVDDENERIDALNVSVRAPEEDELHSRALHRAAVEADQ